MEQSGSDLDQDQTGPGQSIYAFEFNSSTMSILPRPPVLKPFRLALVQLGGLGSNKADNLKHARDMILKAARGVSGSDKPNLIVLPVRLPVPLS
jgi:hypothetical protein